VIDFIEISGGNYINAKFVQIPDEETKTPNKREAFYAVFAEQAKRVVKDASEKRGLKPPAILLTGGFRSRTSMADAIDSEKPVTDLIGLGRSTCLHPQFPRDVVLNQALDDSKAFLPLYRISGTAIFTRILPTALVGAGLNTLWHSGQLKRIATGRTVDPTTSFLMLFFECYVSWKFVVLSIVFLRLSFLIYYRLFNFQL
jgi:hypothetical protein